MEEKNNHQLTEKDLPHPRADWKGISRFAHTFDAYKHYGSFEACEKTANDSFARYQIDRSLPKTLTDLRGCLFFEARRWEHLNRRPDHRSLGYIQSLVEEIRRKVTDQEIECP